MKRMSSGVLSWNWELATTESTGTIPKLSRRKRRDTNTSILTGRPWLGLSKKTKRNTLLGKCINKSRSYTFFCTFTITTLSTSTWWWRTSPTSKYRSRDLLRYFTNKQPYQQIGKKPSWTKLFSTVSILFIRLILRGFLFTEGSSLSWEMSCVSFRRMTAVFKDEPHRYLFYSSCEEKSASKQEHTFMSKMTEDQCTKPIGFGFDTIVSNNKRPYIENIAPDHSVIQDRHVWRRIIYLMIYLYF